MNSCELISSPSPVGSKADSQEFQINLILTDLKPFQLIISALVIFAYSVLVSAYCHFKNKRKYLSKCCGKTEEEIITKIYKMP